MVEPSQESTERKVDICVYVIREGLDGREVLLVLRAMNPNIGRWVPLGGALAFDESPRESAERSLQAVGLQAQQVMFRGMITEISPAEHTQWILFIYVVTAFRGDLVSQHAEGQLRWWPVGELMALPKPQSDSVFGPHILDLQNPFYEATMYFDDQFHLVNTIVSAQVGQEG